MTGGDVCEVILEGSLELYVSDKEYVFTSLSGAPLVLSDQNSEERCLHLVPDNEDEVGDQPGTCRPEVQ